MNQIYVVRVTVMSSPTDGVYHDVYADEKDVAAIEAFAIDCGCQTSVRHFAGWLPLEDAKSYIGKITAAVPV